MESNGYPINLNKHVCTHGRQEESQCVDDSIFAHQAVFNFAMCYLKNKSGRASSG